MRGLPKESKKTPHIEADQYRLLDGAGFQKTYPALSWVPNKGSLKKQK